MPGLDPTVAAAKSYLYTQTLANTALFGPPVFVGYDEPEVDKPDDIVLYGDIHWRPQINAQVGSGGLHWLEERYDIELVIDSYRGGDDPISTFNRAAALFAGVIQVVRADPSLGGLVLIAKPGEATMSTAPSEDHMGWISHFESHIQCYQQL